MIPVKPGNMQTFWILLQSCKKNYVIIILPMKCKFLTTALNCKYQT